MHLIDMVTVELDTELNLTTFPVYPGQVGFMKGLSIPMLKMGIEMSALAIVFQPNDKGCDWHLMQRGNEYDFAACVAVLNQQEGHSWDRWQFEPNGTIRSVCSNLDLHQILKAIGHPKFQEPSQPALSVAA
jgi:hypothetical protein